MTDVRLMSVGLEENRYSLIGSGMALSLIHGGPSPVFLSQTLYKLITGIAPTIDELNLNDVTDEGVRLTLQKACNFIQHLEVIYCCHT
jgi:hypothetical protein